MKAIEILSALSGEIDLCYESTDDFAKWVPVKSVIEASKENYLYVIDYSIISKDVIESSLSVYEKKYLKWTKIDIDNDLKIFIENSFSGLLRLRYDELFFLEEKLREDEEKEKEIQLAEYADCCNTEYSLQFFR